MGQSGWPLLSVGGGGRNRSGLFGLASNSINEVAYSLIVIGTLSISPIVPLLLGRKDVSE
jgi:hypothetical protein